MEEFGSGSVEGVSRKGMWSLAEKLKPSMVVEMERVGLAFAPVRWAPCGLSRRRGSDAPGEEWNHIDDAPSDFETR